MDRRDFFKTGAKGKSMSIHRAVAPSGRVVEGVMGAFRSPYWLQIPIS